MLSVAARAAAVPEDPSVYRAEILTGQTYQTHSIHCDPTQAYRGATREHGVDRVASLRNPASAKSAIPYLSESDRLQSVTSPLCRAECRAAPSTRDRLSDAGTRDVEGRRASVFQEQTVCPTIPIEIAAIPPHAVLAVASTLALQVVELVPDPMVGLVQCRGLHIVVHGALVSRRQPQSSSSSRAHRGRLTSRALQLPCIQTRQSSGTSEKVPVRDRTSAMTPSQSVELIAEGCKRRGQQ